MRLLGVAEPTATALVVPELGVGLSDKRILGKQRSYLRSPSWFLSPEAACWARACAWGLRVTLSCGADGSGGAFRDDAAFTAASFCAAGVLWTGLVCIVSPLQYHHRQAGKKL